MQCLEQFYTSIPDLGRPEKLFCSGNFTCFFLSVSADSSYSKSMFDCFLEKNLS